MARLHPPSTSTLSSPAEPPRYRLRASVDGSTLSFNIPRRDAVVGSGESCDFVLPVRGVSRRHATLTWEGRELVLTDLASKNGTFVNQLRAQSSPIAPGDVIRLGPVSLVLEAQDREDVVVALPARSVALPGERDLTAPWFDGAGGGPLGPWELGERLCRCLLETTPPDFAQALQLVGMETRAEAGLVAAHHDAGKAIALASFGPAEHQPSEGEVEHLLSGREARAVATAGHHTWTLVAPVHGRYLLALYLGDGGSSSAEGPGRLLLRLTALAHRSPAAGKPRQPAALPSATGFVRATSPAMAAVYRQIGELRRSDFPVLLLGETGVGKEHLVRLLHDASPHAAGPFVALNCAAIPAELLEAELFGIGKGVATGVAERPGKVREADRGTLFLDEVGDMPLALQAKLLRALESGTVQPVGAAPVQVKVRFVAATNADLQARITAGQFRADLYYRLGGYQLRVPPLRERREDIALLLEHFITKACRETGKAVAGITLKALRRLQHHDWPGNVRQLENEVRQLVVRCPDGQAIDSGLLPVEMLASREPGLPADRTPDFGLDLEGEVGALERRLITLALEQARGSRAAAAKLLGLSRNGLAAKMERLGIDVRPQIEVERRER